MDEDVLMRDNSQGKKDKQGADDEDKQMHDVPIQ